MCPLISTSTSLLCLLCAPISRYESISLEISMISQPFRYSRVLFPVYALCLCFKFRLETNWNPCSPAMPPVCCRGWRTNVGSHRALGRVLRVFRRRRRRLVVQFTTSGSSRARGKAYHTFYFVQIRIVIAVVTQSASVKGDRYNLSSVPPVTAFVI